MKVSRINTILLLSLFLIGCSSSKKTVNKTRTHFDNPYKTTSTVVKDARRLIDSPYRFGGESPRGFDCSGFVMYVYKKNGVSLPRRSADQARYGKSISLKNVEPGDLLFFKSGNRVNHVGIVTSNRGKYPRMVHASSSKGVIESDLTVETYWQKRVAFARRL